MIMSAERKRRRISEDSHSSNNDKEETSSEEPCQFGGDDALTNILNDRLVSLPSSDSEESIEVGGQQTEPLGDHNDLNLFVEDPLEAVKPFLLQDDVDSRLNESQPLDNQTYFDHDQACFSEGEEGSNAICIIEEELPAVDISHVGDEKSCEHSQDSISTSVNNIVSEHEQEINFDISDHLTEYLKHSLTQPEEDSTQAATDNNLETVFESPSHCHESVLASDALVNSEEDHWAHISSVPLTPTITPSSSTLCKFSPIKIEDLLISHQPDQIDDGSSTGSDDRSSAESDDGDSSDSEEESSDSDNSQDDGMSEFFVAMNLIGEHEQTLNESNESILDPDSAEELVSTIRKYDKELFSGSALTVQEGILQIMNLFIKDRLSKKGLQRLIKTICDFLPANHNFPTSSYKVLSFIESLAPPVPAVKHFYCEKCVYYHGESNAGRCAICEENTFSHYYIFDIEALIKYFFESRNLADLIDSEAAKRAERNPKLVTDLKDGSVYKALNRKRNQYDVNIMLNSDGVRVRKGKSELWLAMFTIAELPIHLQRSFLTIIGVWYHPKKPDMRVFLKPLSESLQKLDKNGIEWTHPRTRLKHVSCVRLPLTVLDAPARAMVQNTKYFNSKYGCNLCEIKAQRSMPIPNRKAVRIYHYVQNPPLRNKERMLEQAEEAVTKGKEQVKGVKGPSVLSIVPSVDISKCIVPEYLHSVLLGVTKQLVSLWCSSGPWSLLKRITEIDAFLLTFKHPDFVHRSSRQLKSLKNWKASDFYYFLLFEALPALQGHLPDPYLQHFMLLVKSIFTLLKSSLKESVILDAELLLKLFVNQFMSLYGDRNLTYNVHQLLHLAECVRQFGPLFCFSAFFCEDLNGMVSKRTHGTINIDAEIVNNIKLCQGIHMLESIVRGHHGLNIPDQRYSEGEFLGGEVSKSLLSPENLLVLPDSNPIIYAKAKLGFDNYTSEIYKTLTSENFNVLWDDQGTTMYGSIIYFARCSVNNYVVLRVFTVDHTSVFYHKKTLRSVEQFIPVNVSNNVVAVKFSDIASKIVKVGKIGRFIYVRPHLYRFVL